MSTAKFRESSKLGAKKHTDAMRDMAIEASMTDEQQAYVRRLQAERDHLRRALEWLAGEFMWLIEPRVHSVEQIVVSALAITEEPA